MPTSWPRSRWMPTAFSSTSTRRKRSPNCAARSGHARRDLLAKSPFDEDCFVATLPAMTAKSALRVVDQVGGEIGRLQLERLEVAVAGEGARDQDVVLDLRLVEAEDAARPLE